MLLSFFNIDNKLKNYKIVF